MRFSVKELTFAAVIAALYAALTLLLAPISFGPVQFRIAEALCILPFFFPCSIWGLFVGCILANLIGGYGILDIVFGSLATLGAALCTSGIRNKPLAALPPVIFNGVIVGALLAWTLAKSTFLRSFLVFGLQVAGGEAAVLYVLGLPMLYLLPRWKYFRDLIAKYGKKA